MRLTAAQAIVRYLAALRARTQDGVEPLFAGVFAIFGHGNVAGMGEALYAQRAALPTFRAHNEQAMAHAAIAYAKAKFRRRMLACTTSIGPGATNLVTAAALAHVNRLPVLFLPGDVFISRAPDPVLQPGLHFEPVFDYEQVLVVAQNHPLAQQAYARPRDLQGETLLSYPVSLERLDIYSQFLLPAGAAPAQHKTLETTDIMLQIVASGRGVAALPRWLVLEYAQRLPILPVRLGKAGIAKQIHLGWRQEDWGLDYLAAFVQAARL